MEICLPENQATNMDCVCTPVNQAVTTNSICLPIKLGPNGICIPVSQGGGNNGICLTNQQETGGNGCLVTNKQETCTTGFTTKTVTCKRQEIIRKVNKLMDCLEDANLEARCCCIDTFNPPEGTRIVTPSTLDGEEARTQTVTIHTGKVIWVPPPIDNRPIINPSMPCYTATVAGQCYDQFKGCRLDCNDISQWCQVSPSNGNGWNNPCRGQGSVTSQTVRVDYCEDRNFVAPQPTGHQGWSNEPGGLCRYPLYCKADCFEHKPERDWASKNC